MCQRRRTQQAFCSRSLAVINDPLTRQPFAEKPNSAQPFSD